jgi:hypothetical protein
MIRQALGFCAILTLASSVHAEPPNPDTRVPVMMGMDKAREAKKTALIAEGDRLRRIGRFSDAAQVYVDALEQADDPVVAGRLGVLLARFGNPALAADYLLDAIERGTSAPPAERAEFLQAYDQARALVCRVVVDVSEAHAQILLDGELKQPDGITGFTMFIVPGNHELRASLAGFDDAFVSFAATKGNSLNVKLVLHSRTLLKLTRVVVPQTEPTELRRRKVERPNIAGDPNASSNEDPDYVSPEEKKAKDAAEARASHGSVFAGPVVVFGVASWAPAVGAVVGGAWRPNEYLSFGLEGRAAWLTVGVAGKPISAMTAGGVVSACGHLKWFFGCALGHAGIVRGEFSSGTFVAKSYVSPKIGGGGRIGAQVRLSQSFSLTGTVDALVMNSGVRVGLDGKVLVDQPPIMVGSQVVAGWEF